MLKLSVRQNSLMIDRSIINHSNEVRLAINRIIAAYKYIAMECIRTAWKVSRKSVIENVTGVNFISMPSALAHAEKGTIIQAWDEKSCKL